MGNDLVKVFTARNLVEALSTESFLKAHGIHVFVQGYHSHTIAGGFGASEVVIDLNILVPENQVPTAMKILHEISDRATMAAPTENPVLKPRSARMAIFLDFFLPGLGNVYAGRKILGAGIIAAVIEYCSFDQCF